MGKTTSNATRTTGANTSTCENTEEYDSENEQVTQIQQLRTHMRWIKRGARVRSSKLNQIDSV
jgi:hypothetical protein